MEEQLDALELALAASVKVQEEDLSVRSDTRDGEGAAATREPSAARPRSWKECMMSE
jgi:hypothetical protein